MATTSVFVLLYDQAKQLKSIGAFDKVQAYMATLGLDVQVAPPSDADSFLENSRKGFEGKRFGR